MFSGKLAVIVEDSNGNKKQIHEISSYMGERWAQISVQIPKNYTGQSMSVSNKGSLLCDVEFGSI